MRTRNRIHQLAVERTARTLRGSAETRRSRRRLRPQLLADAVVANYIHEISVRHGPDGHDPPSAVTGRVDGELGAATV